MTSLICGSLAFDTIMSFGGRFSEALLADQLHKINVAFLVPGIRREFGGCDGNIAYNLKLLNGDPLIMATLRRGSRAAAKLVTVPPPLMPMTPTRAAPISLRVSIQSTGRMTS